MRSAVMGVNTLVQSLTNNLSDNILFIDTENAGCNKEIPANRTFSIGCVVPWCTTQSDFPSRNMAIIDVSSGTVLFYVWQRNASDGNFVRFSTTGFVDPGAAIPGTGRAGGSPRNLLIDANGISLNPTS
jgi:hypothetical protein